MADLSRAEAMRILGLTGELNEAAITAAFKRQVLAHHPDKHPGDSEVVKKTRAAAAEAFKQLIPAKDFLLKCIKIPPESRLAPPQSRSVSPTSTQGVSEEGKAEDENEVLEIIIDGRNFVIDLTYLDLSLPKDILDFIKAQLLIPHISDGEVFDALEEYLGTREPESSRKSQSSYPGGAREVHSRSYTSRFDATKSIEQPDATELKAIAEYVVSHKKKHLFTSHFERAAYKFLDNIKNPKKAPRIVEWKWFCQLRKKTGDMAYSGLTRLDKYRDLIERAKSDLTPRPRHK